MIIKKLFGCKVNRIEILFVAAIEKEKEKKVNLKNITFNKKLHYVSFFCSVYITFLLYYSRLIV